MKAELKDFSDLEKNEYLDAKAMTKEELDQAFAVLDEKMNGLYKFVLLYNDYMNSRQSYAPDIALTVLEAHTLADICDTENPTVTELAASWNRSVSATSQTVRRLMANGLVTRENAPHSGKIFYLRPTEKGLRATEIHKRYDVDSLHKMFRRLQKTLSLSEIEAGFRMLEEIIKKPQE